MFTYCRKDMSPPLFSPALPSSFTPFYNFLTPKGKQLFCKFISHFSWPRIKVSLVPYQCLVLLLILQFQERNMDPVWGVKMWWQLVGLEGVQHVSPTTPWAFCLYCWHLRMLLPLIPMFTLWRPTQALPFSDFFLTHLGNSKTSSELLAFFAWHGYLPSNM